jgi:hypothetical protein
MPARSRALGGDRLAGYVGRYLGVERDTARRLLVFARSTARNRHLLRITAFLLATRPPFAKALPSAVRSRAVNALLGPMLADPRAILLYAAGRDETALGRDAPVQCES